MNNNRGFTLVELLAVIVILLSLSVAIGWGITSVLEKYTENECEEQIELAVGAAKIYFSLNETREVTIGELKDKDYFANNKKLDKLKDTDIIKLTTTGYSYTGTTCQNN